MAIIFDDIDLLLNYAESAMEEILRLDTSKMAVDTVKAELDAKLYSMPESDYYTRTGELRNSVVSVFDDKYSGGSAKGTKRIEIKHDTSQTYMSSGHRSWVNNSIQNRNIPMWINEGYGGLSTFLGIHYYESSFDKISNKLISTFIQGFKRFGITSTPR